MEVMWLDSFLTSLARAPMDPDLLLLKELQRTQATSRTMRTCSSSPPRQDAILSQLVEQPRCRHACERLNGDPIASTFFAKLCLHSFDTSVGNTWNLLAGFLHSSGRPFHICPDLSPFRRRPSRCRPILHGKLRHLGARSM